MGTGFLGGYIVRCIMNDIEINNLTISYHTHPAVHHLTGVFKKGSLTAIVGPNGAGKTTLMEALSGRISPTVGDIHIQPGLEIAYLPQKADLDLAFPITVWDMVLMGSWRQCLNWKAATPGIKQKAAQALEEVGLNEFSQRFIGELSSGQLQRVLCARLMMQDADIILLDEPLNSLDINSMDILLKLIQEWHDQGKTLIAVLHDFKMVQAVFPQSLLLSKKKIFWGETADALTEENLEQASKEASLWRDDAPWCAA